MNRLSFGLPPHQKRERERERSRKSPPPLSLMHISLGSLSNVHRKKEEGEKKENAKRNEGYSVKTEGR